VTISASTENSWMSRWLIIVGRDYRSTAPRSRPAGKVTTYAARIPTILLIRHGQASYGTAVYDRLSECGVQQSEAAARELRQRGLNVTRIVSGSLERQRGTAAPAVEALGVPLEVDARLDEYDMDDILAAHSDTDVRSDLPPGAEAVSSAEFQRVLEAGMRVWIEAGESSPAPDTWPGFQGRCRAALQDVAAGLEPGTTGLVFTSAGVIAALCCSILELPSPTVIPLNRVSVNASMTKLASGRSGLSLISFNEHAYLEHAGRSLITLR
jgi:broad specificity phosphatase PhoE